MMRCVLAALAIVTTLSWSAVPVDAQTDDESAASDDTEPVDLNAAVLGDLLALPGMDDDLARVILAVRDSLGGVASVEDLFVNPSITPARLLPVHALLRVDAGKRSPAQLDVEGTVRSASSGAPRSEIKAVFRSVGPTAAVRVRRRAPEGPETTLRLAAPLPGGFRVTAGDLTPVDGLGLLLGVSNRPPPRGILVPAGRPSTLPPPAGGRGLRGVQLRANRFLSLGIFDRDGAGIIAVRGSPAVASGGAGVSPALVRTEGGLWSGVTLTGAGESAAWTFETVRDPDGRWRYAVVASSRGDGSLRVFLSATGGARAFVNPLGSDFESSRNANRNETALRVRARLRRGLALEVETRAALEGASTRRSWDRAVGYGRARLEASLGSGWSLLSETRVENRSAPGPTDVADAPLRRHAGVLRLGWERRRNHLRVEWQGKLDFEVPRDPGEVAVIDAVTDVVQVRGRAAPRRWLRVAGGVSRYRTPPAAPATLYEERPPGLYPAVFVRGTGRRIHVVVDVVLGGLSGGFFAARETGADGVIRESWGVSIRAVRLFSQPLASIDSRRAR